MKVADGVCDAVDVAVAVAVGVDVAVGVWVGVNVVVDVAVAVFVGDGVSVALAVAVTVGTRAVAVSAKAMARASASRCWLASLTKYTTAVMTSANGTSMSAIRPRRLSQICITSSTFCTSHRQRRTVYQNHTVNAIRRTNQNGDRI